MTAGKEAARYLRIVAGQERKQPLMTAAAKARDEWLERTASHLSGLGHDDPAVIGLSRIQKLRGADGPWQPGEHQTKAVAKLDGAWASAGGKEASVAEPTVEGVVASLVSAGLDDVVAHEARKLAIEQTLTAEAKRLQQLAERERDRARQELNSVKDQLDVVAQSHAEQLAHYRPMAAQLAALLDGLISPDEAAELVRGEPVKA